MRRRDLLLWVCAAALPTSPLLARAEQKVPVIGFLRAGRKLSFPNAFMAALHKGLSEVGYVEGQNLTVEYRWAEGDYNRLPGLAAELVERGVDLLTTGATPATRAAKNATSTIPIVFMGVGDPVGFGLVDSLARPGGNITGFSDLNTELNPKRLELLSELVPWADVIALLVNSNQSNEGIIREMHETARSRGVQLAVLKAGTASEIDSAFVTLVEAHAGAMVVAGDIFFANRREQIVELASRHAIPTIYTQSDFAAAGGLISYGINYIDVFRETGIYAGRILKGEKPANLPVQQPKKFELVVNLKAAKALGLTVPRSLLARADEVIE